jgi:pyridoxal phosphate enzyme (YggS family)
MSVAGRLAEVHARIDRAAQAAGRSPAGVKLIAVSKTKPAEAIREAYAAGQRAFGENYAQELSAKAEALADLADIEWHFIGHLQTNKAKVAAKCAQVVHTIDSAALARELGKRAGKERSSPLSVLIEVNLGGEPQKAGATPGEIDEVMASVRAQPSLALCGLMTVPPAGDLDAARRTFETLALLRNLHGGAAALPELSMGMSEDLEVAIACGATYVRVGRAIFGER